MIFIFCLIALDSSSGAVMPFVKTSMQWRKWLSRAGAGLGLRMARGEADQTQAGHEDEHLRHVAGALCNQADERSDG